MSDCFFTKIYKELLIKAKEELKCPSWSQYHIISIIEYYHLGTIEDRTLIECLGETCNVDELLAITENKVPFEELGLISSLFNATNLNDNQTDHQIRIIYAFWITYIDKLPGYQKLLSEVIKQIPNNDLKRRMVEILSITILKDDNDQLLEYSAPAILELLDIIDRLDESLIFDMSGDDIDVYENIIFKINPQHIINITNHQNNNHKILNKIKLVNFLKTKLIDNRNKKYFEPEFKRH